MWISKRTFSDLVNLVDNLVAEVVDIRKEIANLKEKAPKEANPSETDETGKREKKKPFEQTKREWMLFEDERKGDAK